MNMHRFVAATALATLLVGASACGPGPELATTTVSLALDFNADALLELYVVDEASASCADLLGGLAPDGDVNVFAVDRTPASGLNGGGTVTFTLEEIPAEVPLAFFARALQDGLSVAQDCAGGVVVPAGGNLDVTLVVAAP